jgi:TRAP-type C4-dicarboxylate transport system permease small subunit
MTPLLDRLTRAIDALVIAGGAIVCLIVFMNVIARYVFDFGVAWVNEVGETVFVWLTFLAGATAVRRYGHLAVIEFAERLPRRLNRALFIALWLLTATILLGLIWYGASLSQEQMRQTMSATGWPVGIVYWAMPVGSLLAVVFVVEQILAGHDFTTMAEAGRVEIDSEAAP